MDAKTPGAGYPLILRVTSVMAFLAWFNVVAMFTRAPALFAISMSLRAVLVIAPIFIACWLAYSLLVPPRGRVLGPVPALSVGWYLLAVGDLPASIAISAVGRDPIIAARLVLFAVPVLAVTELLFAARRARRL